MKHILNIIIISFILLTNTASISASSDNVTTYPGDFETGTTEDEVYDPLEPINRVIFSFNNFADKIVLQPVAKGYRKLPSPIRAGSGNMVKNLSNLVTIPNNILKGELKKARKNNNDVRVTLKRSSS